MIAIPAHKYGMIFRFVEESDAAFILSLRTDPVLSRHLSPTDNALEKQVEWIRGYKKREEKGEEYYFLFESELQEPLGVMRLYDFKDKTYNCGSWLIKPGNDEFTAIKSDLFVSSFAMNELKFDKCLFDVRKDNKKVARYHKIFSIQIAEDEINLYLMTDREAFQKKQDYLTSIIQAEI